MKDIELKRGGLVYVNRGKGDKERVVPATSEVRSRVQEYLSMRGDVSLDEPLFLSNQRRRISVRTVEHMLRQLGEQYHPHALRHTFVRAY
ncbi:tyrosine-type recombinase/integrase [Alicyclobacillus macrosporangiidus]|uniref:tyrosine-type recombinase/integrase n=1 Tax=Alicyclobacillus macrosporangiidus TaxID=392015 RepID=UPI0009456EBF